ncbi:MAG: hypothetical protein CMJ29_08160 [Phycisphaerae bacterium]|nr:hypothetical protein [Phycisphaerae bacterium]
MFRSIVTSATLAGMPVEAARIRIRPFAIILLAIAGIGLLDTQTAYGDDSTNTKNAIRHLKRTVTPQRDDSHLTRLTALRGLGDPALEELFLRLVQHDSWQIQVYAVLGLAELTDDGHVMPWLITQITPEARDQVLAVAMDEKRLGPEELEALTGWEELQEANRVALIAYAKSINEDVDIDQLRPLTSSSNEKVAAAAWLVMAWLGDKTALENIDELIDGLPEARQLDILLTMIMLINRYEIREAAAWLDGLLTESRAQSQYREMLLAGTSTLLLLDPERGLNQWRLEFGSNPKRRQQITAALMLLQVGVQLEMEDRSRLDVDDELIGTIVNAGDAVANDQDDVAQRLIELIDLNHVRSTTLIPGVLTDLPSDQAVVVLRRFLERMEQDDFSSVDQMLAIEATERLLEIDPAAVLDTLQSAEDESPLQEAILYGLLRYRDADVLGTVESLQQIGVSRPDSLALLVIARDSNELDDTQLHRLGLIASGGVLVEPLQVQAAWLYLKHTNSIDGALAQLIPESP